MPTARTPGPTGSVVDDLRLQLMELGRLLTHGGQEFCLRVLVDRNLGLSQVRSMLALADAPAPLPISELAGVVELSVAAAGRTVDSLVQDGLVSRDTAPGDRRTKLVELTSAGESLMAEYRLSGQDHLSTRLATVPDELLTRLLAAVQPVVDHLAPATSTEGSAA